MRNPLLVPLAVALLAAAAAPVAEAGDEPIVLRHQIEARIEPAKHEIVVRDRITLPDSWRTAAPLTFQLHSKLDVVSMDGSYEVTKAERVGAIRDVEEVGQELEVRTWTIRPVSGAWPSPAELDLRYSGLIHHPLVSEGEEYARSFSRTPGTIEDQGVVLSGSSWWLPRFGDELITFSLQVNVPQGWDAVSQGSRTAASTDPEGGTAARRVVTWDCPHPMDEAYVIAARFTEYDRKAGDVLAQAFLRTPDENMANKYLEATAQYIAMYRRLIGPYPFKKFALIENFWETGYGMPSFTLLGPRIIRFPFILHSSYPHEILHNWWGNSVYVDWKSGNWCEGLTAYLADHLIREGQGRGSEYRRDALKGYRDYVREGRDFPLVDFRSRHSSATQAIGYGKCLMVFHMARRHMGERAFGQALRRFYAQERFKFAGWTDISRVFSDVAGEDLGPYFEQWTKRAGAPSLTVATELDADGKLHVTLSQTQEGAPFVLDVPVAVTRAGAAEAELLTLSLTEASAEHVLDIADAVRVDVDPEFDLFRRLDQAETPPTISQMFGAEQVALVVPAGDSPMANAWRTMAETWAAGGSNIEIYTDDTLFETGFPPANAAVWLLGSDNALASHVSDGLTAFGAAANADEIRFGVEAVPAADHSFVMIARHPHDERLALGWVGADSPAAVPGLTRKLPHYGKYSFLAFHGAAPDNVVKGSWPAATSPLIAFVGEGKTSRPARGSLPNREPLARLAPVFDPATLRAHVAFLADDEQEGRGIGTIGHTRAADYIAAEFKKIGLTPGAPGGQWYDRWKEDGGPRDKPALLTNIIGIIPGSDPALAGQSVVVSAHYDHLGLGWPDAREGHAGKIHNGADDNASGVSVMIEVAKLLAGELKPARTIVFVAFDGEEWGLKGSRHYLATAKTYPAKKVHSIVNLDTVGRLGDAKLLVLGSGTATEWRHVAMGVGFTTGVESTCVADDPGGSDQVPFHEAGVPGVQLFTGPHEDYHRSTDTLDKVDVDGLVKVATWLRETVVYLSGRVEPLTSTLSASAGTGATGPAKPRQGRRVSLGTMPDFAFEGPGVKVASVIAGTPAEKAGIQAGDIVLAVDGTEMTDLRAYGAALRAKSPGDVLQIRIRRGDDELDLEATLVAR